MAGRRGQSGGAASLPATMDPTLNSLDWNLLRTFFVIVEARSLTQAAHELGIRQPSVTQALKRLEESLGCTLIVRGSRRFELTRHGEILYRECEVMMRSAARIGEKLAGAQGDITGLLKLMFITAVQYEPLDQALARFRQRHPSVNIEIEIVSSPQAIRAVSQRIAPLALCLLAQPIAGLRCRFLMREEFGIYCGPTHPWFGRDDITLEQLRQEPLVAFSASKKGGVMEPLLALGDGAGLARRITGSSTDIGAVLRMIVAGVGIGVLPCAAAAADEQAGRLWRFSPAELALGADLYLITHPALVPEPAEARFLEIFDDCIAAAAGDPRSG
ncbi:hypothetical protein CAL25_21670 [Bordetella genomosp. 5]|uniref:HTH lysR-type domain-containing protein n=1 Tax=Bordetella genomosp. 5 TaxID=1395608 RepID=A0A261T9B7_9BORD|nr:hypothetical protein CAL25_21670 [Bordetella genomosp. 5]